MNIPVVNQISGVHEHPRGQPDLWGYMNIPVVNQISGVHEHPRGQPDLWGT